MEYAITHLYPSNQERHQRLGERAKKITTYSYHRLEEIKSKNKNPLALDYLKKSGNQLAIIHQILPKLTGIKHKDISSIIGEREGLKGVDSIH